MKLKVESVGPDQFPRYLISCENGLFYDGKGWTPSKNKAIRYASLRFVKDDWMALQSEMEDVEVLVAEVTVQLKGGGDWTPDKIERLAWFLASASGFTLSYTMPRPEGMEDVVISTQIHWASLKPRPRKKK